MAKDNDFKSLKKALIKALKFFEKAYKIELPLEIQAFIGVEMGTNKVSDSYLQGDPTAFPKAEETFRSGSKLNLKSGKLLQSFHPKDENTISKFKGNSKGKLNFKIGSGLPYAAIQEFGGFVDATPITVQRKGGAFKTFKMSQYFWAIFKKFNNPFHQIMALASHANKGIKITARPYFFPALDKYFAKRYTKFVQEKFFEALIEAKF